MIGERLKLRRQADGMTLQDMSDRLSKAGKQITSATLSNYETGKTVPSEELLHLIADELGTQESFFLTERYSDFALEILSPIALTQKKEVEARAFLQIKLEERLYIDDLLRIPSRWQVPRKVLVGESDFSRIDELTAELRLAFGAGNQPISSVCGLLENNGWFVLQLPKYKEITATIGYVKSPLHPFAAFPVDAWPENVRHDLLNALAYAYIETEQPDQMPRAAHYFASAMLLPKEQILRELGGHRTNVSFGELALLKKRYGMSRFNILRHMTELGYYPEKTFQAVSKSLLQHGFSLNNGPKHTDPALSETPEYFRMRIIQALSENLISQDEAQQLYPFKFESWIF